MIPFFTISTRWGFAALHRSTIFNPSPVPRLEKIYGWLDHIQSLGINALYLGPVFESDAHGYDTADYYQVDRRLGDRQTLAALSRELHRRGIRLVLDGVFNHVGRHFWAFRDVQANQEHSPYREWFDRLDFEKRSPYGDPFSYEGWRGHYNLVKLNLHNPDVKAHLFGAIAQWVEDYKIDGLRLDVADDLLPEFMKELHVFSKNLSPDFWLMGEVARGDYNQWVNPSMLDSVTNYELRKGLFSTHNDNNYFEIAHTLNRQFGASGVYAQLMLYNFADNHDVSRVATSLHNERHLFPLYAILFTIPGIPSIYYGSEWGLKAAKGAHSDDALRPCLDLDSVLSDTKSLELQDYLARLAEMRKCHPCAALRYLPAGVCQLQPVCLFTPVAGTICPGGFEFFTKTGPLASACSATGRNRPGGLAGARCW